MSLLFVLLLLVASITHGDSFTQEDREMLRSTYIRVEKLETKVEVGFQQIEKRFEQIDKRIDTVITLWDRRTMIRPFEDKDKELAELMRKSITCYKKEERHGLFNTS